MAYDPTQSQMPMGESVLPLQGQPVPLPLPTGKPQPAPPQSGGMLPLSGAMPLGMPPSGAPPQMQQAAPAPQAPPYTVRSQPDGSSVYVIASPDGNPAGDIILGVNPPPKIPKAFQGQPTQ